MFRLLVSYYDIIFESTLKFISRIFFFFYTNAIDYSHTLYIVELCPTVKSFHFSNLINDPAWNWLFHEALYVVIEFNAVTRPFVSRFIQQKEFPFESRKNQSCEGDANLSFNFCESFLRKEIPEGKETNKIMQSPKIRNIHPPPTPTPFSAWKLIKTSCPGKHSEGGELKEKIAAFAMAEFSRIREIFIGGWNELIFIRGGGGKRLERNLRTRRLCFGRNKKGGGEAVHGFSKLPWARRRMPFPLSCATVGRCVFNVTGDPEVIRAIAIFFVVFVNEKNQARGTILSRN